jgi:hypothetical protein
MEARVEIEEDIYSYQPAENGASPMWCHGGTCIVRVNEELFASGLETLPDARPQNNCRPLLYRRTRDGWRMIFRDERRTREPSPLCCLPDGRIFVSLNPTLAPMDAFEGPAEPQIAELTAGEGGPARIDVPQWDGKPELTEHSYRSFVADGARGELLLLQNSGMTHAAFTFRDATGAWSSRGKLVWPWGAEYEQPQPIRICYPTVQLCRRSVFFCGVSDIEEPRRAWREAKRKITGNEWDYDFRRLFFTWCDDIGDGRFHTWTEIASREKTCGWIRPCDMYVDDETKVHILWTERAIDERLKDAFFPLERQSHCLHYAIIKDGIVLLRRAVTVGDEILGNARFQAAPEGRLFVLYHASKGDDAGKNRLREISREGVVGDPCDVPLEKPLALFFTANVRSGCRPADTLDVLGEVGNTIRYARIRLS